MTDLAPAPGSPRSASAVPRPRNSHVLAGAISAGPDPDPGPATAPSDAAVTDRRTALLGAVARTPFPVLVAVTGALLAGLVPALGLPLAVVALWGLAVLLVHADRGSCPGSPPWRSAVRVGAVTLALGATAGFFLPLALSRVDLAAGAAVCTCLGSAVGSLPRAARGALGTTRTRTVLVGSAVQVDRMVAELSRRGGEELQVTGICLTDSAEDPARLVAETTSRHPGVSVTHGLSRVGPAVSVLDAGAVVALPGPTVGADDLRRLGWQVEQLGATVFVDVGLLDAVPVRTHVTRAGSACLVKVRSSSPAPVRRLVKEVWERSFAAVLLVLLVPLLAVLVLAVRADRGGPGIFRQVRVGRHGREFVLLKLRTMQRDAEEVLTDMTDLNEADEVLFKMRNDPRVTRIGRVLRRYSLDELPQLWNVVRGDMALVGPRPALPSEVAAYPPDAHRRPAVKPGLTGLWQVSGRSDLSWEESSRIDVRYVDNWSLALDLGIVLRTAKAVIGHQGAY